MEFESDGDRVVGKRSEKDVPRNMQEIIDGVYFPRTLSWCGVCSCLEGTENEQLKRNTKRTKCEALDDISGIILGCSAECVPKETRSSSGHKFKVLCRTHLKRLQGHMCCPFCDVFCTQGTFLVCSCGNEGFHFFHAACALKFHHDVKDDVRCPHCGHQPKEEGFDEWSSRIATDSLSEDCKNRLIHAKELAKKEEGRRREASPK
ncbi:unnamed protein product [Notodromas monacha]|uniref:EHMT1/2 cysteine-rich region domain-containing protein n=1 Tax=Notodromas monacha TaxID=399045 RepID=A0A7R9G8D1_9CRUS|nr:unnamed protein product [Notodromas monacha]CAG0913149.1 unnamed protein product [Notodromas monacha]